MAQNPKYRHYLPKWLVSPSQTPRIVVIGAGGTGSKIITELALMVSTLRSLGHPGFDVTVFDGDEVSESNVGRQLFSPSDISLNKAEVMVTRVNRFFGLPWEAKPRMWDGVNDYHPYYSFYISAVDSAGTRMLIAEKLSRSGSGTYWLDTGNTTSTGQIVLGIAGKDGVMQPQQLPGAVAKLPTVVDLYPDLMETDSKALQGPSCSVREAIERQDLLINRWVSTCAVQLLWKGLRKGYLTHHGAFVNSDTFTVRPLPVDPVLWERMGWKPPKKRGRRSAKKAGTTTKKGYA